MCLLLTVMYSLRDETTGTFVPDICSLFTMTTPRRNDKCPCGSGKKYKFCCLEKDRQAALEKEAIAKNPVNSEVFEENPTPAFATWKIFAIGTGILAVIGLIAAFAFQMPRLGGAIFGCGMLILIVFCAFRNEPTVRKRPGDAGNIDFGNRL